MNLTNLTVYILLISICSLIGGYILYRILKAMNNKKDIKKLLEDIKQSDSKNTFIIDGKPIKMLPEEIVQNGRTEEQPTTESETTLQ